MKLYVIILVSAFTIAASMQAMDLNPLAVKNQDFETSLEGVRQRLAEVARKLESYAQEQKSREQLRDLFDEQSDQE